MIPNLSVAIKKKIQHRFNVKEKQIFNKTNKSKPHSNTSITYSPDSSENCTGGRGLNIPLSILD